MNKRIKLLAEQATSIVEMVGPQGYTSSYANFDKEKFAELIVRECIGIVEAQKESLCENQAAWSHDDYGYERAVNDSVDMVKKHFGVEE